VSASCCGAERRLNLALKSVRYMSREWAVLAVGDSEAQKYRSAGVAYGEREIIEIFSLGQINQMTTYQHSCDPKHPLRR
jgi:hypothetical protein